MFLSMSSFNSLVDDSNHSVQFSHSVVSESSWPHGPEHSRPPCPSPTPKIYPNSCLSSQWCHPAITSSVVPFFCCPQSFPASGSFPMSQIFVSGGQSTGVSVSAPVLPMNIEEWFPLGLTGLINWINLNIKGHKTRPGRYWKVAHSKPIQLSFNLLS